MEGCRMLMEDFSKLHHRKRRGIFITTFECIFNSLITVMLYEKIHSSHYGNSLQQYVHV